MTSEVLGSRLRGNDEPLAAGASRIGVSQRDSLLIQSGVAKLAKSFGIATPPKVLATFATVTLGSRLRGNDKTAGEAEQGIVDSAD